MPRRAPVGVLLAGIVATVGLACIAAEGAAKPAPRDEILGTWRGTSTCIKAYWNSACNDEKVVYRFRPTHGATNKVTLDARKMVGGREVPMGVMTFTYRTDKGTWDSEFHTPRRGVILWSYRVSGRTITGTLVELPSRRLVRRVAVVRG